MAEFHLRIVTPEKTLIDGDVRSVQFHGVDGSYGILPNHAPLMTATEAGVVAIEHIDGKREDLVATDGFAEMRDNILTLVCEAGEMASDIDVERAKAAEQRARVALADRGRLSPDQLVATEAALRRAMTRQLVAGSGSTRLR